MRCLSLDSLESENFSLNSLISSSLWSKVLLCFNRRLSTILSCLSDLSWPSSLILSSSLAICRRYCYSLSKTLSLSVLDSSILFLLSTASCCTLRSFYSYKDIFCSWSSSSEMRCSFSRERESNSWATILSSSRASPSCPSIM